MLGSPRTPLALLEQQLEKKIDEITAIKTKLEAEMNDRRDVLEAKQHLRDSAKQMARMVGAVKLSMQQLKKLPVLLVTSMMEWLGSHLPEELDKVRKADQKQILRLTTQLCRVNAHHRHSQQLDAAPSRRGSADLDHQKISQFLRQQDERIALKPCDIYSPMNRELGDELGAAPALEMPVLLETIAEEQDANHSYPRNVVPKVKVRQSCTGITITRTEPTQQLQAPIPIPTIRAESQRAQLPLKDLNKVCVEDLTRMIDKVTPSRIIIKNVVEKIHRKQPTKPAEDISQNWSDEQRESKMQKTNSSHQSHLAKGVNIIELGNKKRSISRQKAQSRDRLEPASEPKIQVLMKSQSREKIKVTVKDGRLDHSRSRSINRIDRKNSYTNNSIANNSSTNNSSTAYQTKTRKLATLVRSQLVDQLSRVQFCSGDRRYELRFEGTKKQNARCGVGRLEYINGLVYEGEFKDDMRHGYGYTPISFRVLSINGKEIYAGNWQTDQMSGRGILKNLHSICRRKLPEDSLLRSATYEGQFRGNTLHGRGSIILQSGQRLEGYFHSNIPQGELTAPLDRSFCLQTSQFQV